MDSMKEAIDAMAEAGRELTRLQAEKTELLSALKIAASAIEDCHSLRSHLHFEELATIRAILARNS